MLFLVDRRDPTAFQHDEEDIELGVRVFDQLMTGRPRQEGRVQVAGANSEFGGLAALRGGTQSSADPVAG